MLLWGGVVSAADAESAVTSGINANANAITNATTAAMACCAKLPAVGREPDCEFIRECDREQREGEQAEEADRMNIRITVRLLSIIMSTTSLRFYDGCRSYPLG